MYNKFFKNKFVVAGLGGIVAGSMLFGSVKAFNHFNSEPASQVEVQAETSTPPVFSIKEDVVRTNNASHLNLTEIAEVKGDDTTKLELGYYVKISDPTALNEEVMKGFSEKLSKKTDKELVEEMKKKEGVQKTGTSLEDGVYTAVLKAENEDGLFSAKPVLIVMDATAPAIAHDAADESMTVDDVTKAPTVSLKENQVVDNFDGAMPAEKVTIEVAEKDASKHIYAVTIKATDASGNEGVLTYDLTLNQKSQATSTTKKATSSKTRTTKSASSGNQSAGASGGGATYTEPANIYKYCPTVINGAVLYCSNLYTPGQVKDGIYLGGTRVLYTTPGSWDSVQVCDPSVIAGNFTFQGGGYRYLMAYLGCRTYNCTNNEVGFAVSNDLYNWVKVGRVVGSEGGWGVGQPSLITHNGNIFLFYTRGTTSLTSTLCRQLNSTDLTNVSLSGPVTVRNMAG
ncbi:MAG: hypothetical protein K5851_01210, partial [Lachnospiraceae bacterium]|nr:hypothetical protein [Lachnospiraceae bacterium]